MERGAVATTVRFGNWVVAIESGAVIGIAGLVDGYASDGRHVEWTWVDPAHRHRGIFRALLKALIDLESGNGAYDSRSGCSRTTTPRGRPTRGSGSRRRGSASASPTAATSCGCGSRSRGAVERLSAALGCGVAPPRRSALRLRDLGVAGFGEPPLPKPQLVHRFPGAADVVGRLDGDLPFAEVFLPGAEESHAQFGRDRAQLLLGRRQRPQRLSCLGGGERFETVPGSPQRCAPRPDELRPEFFGGELEELSVVDRFVVFFFVDRPVQDLADQREEPLREQVAELLVACSLGIGEGLVGPLSGVTDVRQLDIAPPPC